MMIVLLKLLVGTATVFLSLGYAARRRNNFLHRRWMALGVALAVSVPLLVVLGELGFGRSLRTGYWLIDLIGDRESARWVIFSHQALFMMTLVLLITQALLGRLRHPIHSVLARVVIPCWLISWIAALFFYY